MLTAVFTNPTAEQHEKKVKEKALALLKEETGKDGKAVVDLGLQLFGSTLVDQFLQNHIQVDNYYLFSLTKIRWENKETIIGGGAFKQIWLSPKIDDKTKEIVAIIKGS